MWRRSCFDEQEVLSIIFYSMKNNNKEFFEKSKITSMITHDKKIFRPLVVTDQR